MYKLILVIEGVKNLHGKKHHVKQATNYAYLVKYAARYRGRANWSITFDKEA